MIYYTIIDNTTLLTHTFIYIHTYMHTHTHIIQVSTGVPETIQELNWVGSPSHVQN